MFVLTRRSDESIQIGSAKVTVVSVVGGKVRLGIEAPDDVPIARAELRRAGRAAGQAVVDLDLEAARRAG